MCIVIAIPTMAEHLFTKLVREVEAYLPVLQSYDSKSYGLGGKGKFVPERIEFIQLSSYHDLEKADCDIVLTFEDEYSLSFVQTKKMSDECDSGSFLDENVHTNTTKAMFSRKHFKPQEPIILAIANKYGIPLPDGVNFRRSMSHLRLRRPVLDLIHAK